MKKNNVAPWLPWLGALLVVVWRVVAVWYPHGAQTDPAVVRHAMAVMGLFFVGCGLWTLWRAPGRLARLFAWYGITSGLHWGGPIGFGAADWQNALLAFYFIVSGALAASLFLDVAMSFDPSSRGRRVRALVYAPPAIGGALLVVQLATPGSAWLLGLLPLLILIATVTSVVGAGVWFVRWMRATLAERRALGLSAVVAAIAFGWLPYVLVSLGLNPWPVYDGLFNLPMALEPAAVALAIAARARAGLGSPGSSEAPA